MDGENLLDRLEFDNGYSLYKKIEAETTIEGQCFIFDGHWNLCFHP